MPWLKRILRILQSRYSTLLKQKKLFPPLQCNSSILVHDMFSNTAKAYLASANLYEIANALLDPLDRVCYAIKVVYKV